MALFTLVTSREHHDSPFHSSTAQNIPLPSMSILERIKEFSIRSGCPTFRCAVLYPTRECWPRAYVGQDHPESDGEPFVWLALLLDRDVEREGGDRHSKKEVASKSKGCQPECSDATATNDGDERRRHSKREAAMEGGLAAAPPRREKPFDLLFAEGTLDASARVRVRQPPTRGAGGERRSEVKDDIGGYARSQLEAIFSVPVLN